jgi:hypothetical protein
MLINKYILSNSIKKSDDFLKWYKQKKIKTKNIDLLKKMYSEYQYKEYLRLNPIKKYTDNQIKQLDKKLTGLIVEELKHTSSLGIDEYMVEHKWNEIQEFHNDFKTTPAEVEEVKNLMWKPKGRSDYRRIEPELLLTTDTADIQHTDFWGNTTYRQQVVDNKFLKHWNILRVFISSSRHDFAIGRQLHYLVRDRRTQTYLGIICIQSSLRNIKPRNDELFGTPIDEKKLEQLLNLKTLIANTTNIQTKKTLEEKRNKTLLQIEHLKKLITNTIKQVVVVLSSKDMEFFDTVWSPTDNKIKRILKEKTDKTIVDIEHLKTLISNLTETSNVSDIQIKKTLENYKKTILEIETEIKNAHIETRKIYNRAFGAGAGARQLHMANGQTIMGTQPFSRIFNGGKLLALLCISDEVQKDWKTRYGDTLVTVETTSLYGEKDQTQYDGLKPFWINLGEKTSGQTVIKPSDDLYHEIKRWMKRRYPQVFFRHMREKNINGQNAVRETKNQLITKTYQRLGIKKLINTYTNHQRGVYLSKLYSNAELFLQYKIEEKELIPQKFDTSIEGLVNFWKFGFQGDTKETKNQKLIEIANNKIRHANKNSPAKVRLQYWIDKTKKQGQSPVIEHLPTDWYGQMQELSLAESKKLYLDQVGR